MIGNPAGPTAGAAPPFTDPPPPPVWARTGVDNNRQPNSEIIAPLRDLRARVIGKLLTYTAFPFETHSTGLVSHFGTRPDDKRGTCIAESCTPDPTDSNAAHVSISTLSKSEAAETAYAAFV